MIKRKHKLENWIKKIKKIHHKVREVLEQEIIQIKNL